MKEQELTAIEARAKDVLEYAMPNDLRRPLEDIPALITEIRRLREQVSCEWCGGEGKRNYRDSDGPVECHNCRGTGQHRCEGKP